MSLLGVLFLFLFSTPISVFSEIATIQEIPYYLKQLQETELESKRMETNKIIHDAVVHADLSNKKTVKTLEPFIARIRLTIQAGFDRPYLEGTSSWLQSAVDYFEREKYRPIINIPMEEWTTTQTSSQDGSQISIFPEKIVLIKEGQARTIAESSNIHEAVISPDSKKVAFFRRSEETPTAEIWVVHLKNLKRKKIITVPSCQTLLFSLNGDHLFIQEKPENNTSESKILRISTGGGKAKTIGKARSLEAVVTTGKYRGGLVVTRMTPHHLGVTLQDCPVAWDEAGKEWGRIQGAACR
ncbi:MAG: hypothetical protein KCHDKBKB_02177 [Elusimicrobia bacterium]|nr:hypothetical protein [Elusimicrobiota bacterium]